MVILSWSTEENESVDFEFNVDDDPVIVVT